MEEIETNQLIEQSFGHKLSKASRLFQDYGVQKLRDSMKVDAIKPSHLKLFPHIEDTGSSVVEIAKKLGISKQATGLLVNELIEFNVLVKEDNPEDKRSFLVKFNKKKSGPYIKGISVFQELDEVITKSMTKRELEILSSALDKVINICQK